MAEERVRWRGDFSVCGRFMIQTSRIRAVGTEYQLVTTADGRPGPPWERELGIFDTRREVKARADEYARTGRR